MASPIISPEDVLHSLRSDGTIDALRLKIINQLKANEELKKTTISMVENSKVLKKSGAEKQTKRELFDALRQELEAPVLEMASKSVWELIVDTNNDIGKEISETVENVFCKLSGQETPLFPTASTSGAEKEKVGKGENASSSSSKKRSYSEINEGGCNGKTNNGSSVNDENASGG